MQPQLQPNQPYNTPGHQPSGAPHQYPNGQPVAPQQPQPVKKPKKKISAKILLIGGIVLTSLLILGCIALWVVLDKEKSSDSGVVSTEVASLLTPEGSAPVSVKVSSSLGVKVPFNGYELAGFAMASGSPYSGSDLVTERDYSVIRVRPVETSQATRSQLSLESPGLRVTASPDLEYWDKVEADAELAELSRIDAVIEQAKLQRLEANPSLKVSDVAKVKMGEVEYSKVSFTLVDKNFGIESTVREDCYVAIQNNRPYTACINNIRPTNFSVASQLEQALADVTYSAPDEDALVSGMSAEEGDALVGGGEAEDEVILDDAEQVDAGDVEAAKDEQGEGEPKSDEKSLTYLPESTQDFVHLAKLSPSVARVGTIYCADIKLTYPSSSQGITLTGACNDVAGTGFFVSTDGLLATAASNVSVRPAEAITSYIVNAPSASLSQERLDRVLTYMVEARYIMESDAEGIKTGVQQGDVEAVAKVRSIADKIDSGNITVESESYSHALQLGTSPVVVNSNANGSLSFAFSDSVVEIEKVATDYDENRSQSSVFDGSDKSSDLALMKVKQSISRPALAISNGILSSGAVLYSAGLPMYTGSNLESGQLSAYQLYRFGEVQDVFDREAGKVASVLTPSHAGLRGAPAVNDTGQVVGVFGYNNIACPESSCIGGSVVESPNGIIAMARSKNIALSANSTTSDTWSRAIDAFVVGNYRDSIRLLEDVQQSDPHNNVAAGLVAYAKESRGGADDTSETNLMLTAVRAALVVLAILLILLILGLLSLKLFRRSSGQRPGGQAPSGGMAANPMTSPTQPQYPPQGYSQVNQGYGQPTQPQSQQSQYNPAAAQIQSLPTEPQVSHDSFRQVQDMYSNLTQVPNQGQSTGQPQQPSTPPNQPPGEEGRTPYGPS